MLVKARLLPGAPHATLLFLAPLYLGCGVSLFAIPAVNRSPEYANQH